MSLEDLGITDYVATELHIDGDIVIYKQCCIFNEDTDEARASIAKYVKLQIDKLMAMSQSDKYIFFLTTKTNFRDFIVDDYKKNREGIERPVNLKWAKSWAMKNTNAHYETQLEADDLLGIYQNENSIIWSLDKDLRQIHGRHLDDASGEVIDISYEGSIIETKRPKKSTKYYFDGMMGFYFQLLTGDSTDYILGCGTRVEKVYKTGAKAGQEYIARQGIGPGAAYKLLNGKSLTEALQVVRDEYEKIHGEWWIAKMEAQAHLLWMVRHQCDSDIKMWTHDDRDLWMNLETGAFHE